MLTAGRALMNRAVPRLDASIAVGEQSLALVLVAVLLSALATEFIGVHAIFGAFLFGAIIPHKSAIARHVRERIEDVVRVMFLPAFFAFTGMRTQIGLLQTAGRLADVPADHRRRHRRQVRRRHAGRAGSRGSTGATARRSAS